MPNELMEYRKSTGSYQNVRYKRDQKERLSFSDATQKKTDIKHVIELFDFFFFISQIREIENADNVFRINNKASNSKTSKKLNAIQTAVKGLSLFTPCQLLSENGPVTRHNAAETFAKTASQSLLPVPASVYALPHTVTDLGTAFYTTFSAVTDKLHDTAQFFGRYDPLRLPVAAAVSVPFSENLSPGPSTDMFQIHDKELQQALFKAVTGKTRLVNEEGQQLQSVFSFFYQQKRNKRVAMSHSLRQQQEKHNTYTKGNCHIRTKTNQGTMAGNLLLMGGEVIRNPILSAIESFNLVVKGRTENSAVTESVSEWVNIATDIIAGVFTAGCYPIIKYGSAKLFTAAGHLTNHDMPCLKDEFNPEQLANILLQTETGVTKTGTPGGKTASSGGGSRQKMKEYQNIRTFQPDGVFFHENVASGINTVNYFKVRNAGKDYLIKEKTPGELYAYHIDDSSRIIEEIKVYFHKGTGKIHFNREMPESTGLDYDIINGKSFIEIKGNYYEFSVKKDWGGKEISFETAEGVKNHIPVYGTFI